MKPRLNVIWNEMYLIDLEISHIELEKLLPKSYLKENLKAIQLGYDINLYED
jgi:hypothetical protein